MATPQFDVLWRITPNQDFFYASKFLSGLRELVRDGIVSLRATTRSPFTEPHGIPMFLEVYSRSVGVTRKVILDLHDKADLFYPSGLAYADVYFKRGYDPTGQSQLPPESLSRVVPLGLTFPTLSPCARWFLGSSCFWAFLGNLGRATGTSVKGRLRKFWLDSKLLRGLPPPAAFEQDPTAPRQATVLFQTRVWPSHQPGDDFALVNQDRIALVKSLRGAFGEHFVGGIQADAEARKLCPDALAETHTHRSAYVELGKNALVGVYSRGLYHSLAFKLAEYLAAGLCIVSEPLHHRLPTPLQAGVHYLPYTTHEECIAQCRRLLNDPAESARMRDSNFRYYQTCVAPRAHMLSVLERTFAA